MFKITLTISAILMILSLFFFAKKNTSLALILLTAITFLSYLSLIEIEPFLNLWDERFHALVAKNLSNNPILPLLYPSTPVEFDHIGWDKSHLWLHKQPLFLWQIALSFKLFGISELSLRLPSAVMMTLLVPIYFRIGKALDNEKTGFFMGLLLSSSYFIMELVVGRQQLDHNDIAFLFYTSSSLWAWIEYLRSGKKSWLILIGIFSGFAILCKWLTGLLIYFTWGIYKLIRQDHLKNYTDLLISLLFTVIVILPWQLYILSSFTDLAIEEYRYNSQHLFEAIEGHTGSPRFHLKKMDLLFGNLAPYFALLGIFFFWRKKKNKSLFLSFIITLIFVELFFAIAKTKMISYTLILMPFIYFLASVTIYQFYSYLTNIKANKKLATAIFTILLLSFYIYRIQLPKLSENYLSINYYNYELANNKAVFEALKDRLPKNSLLFNVKDRHYVEAMFYTNFNAYSIIPDQAEINRLKSKFHIAIFKSGNYELPNYILNDPSIELLDGRLF